MYPNRRSICCKDAHLIVNTDDFTIAEYMSAIKLFGALVNLLSQLSPPLVPFTNNLTRVESFRRGLLMIVANLADGSGADCAAEANGIIVLVLTWHRICRY